VLEQGFDLGLSWSVISNDLISLLVEIWMAISKQRHFSNMTLLLVKSEILRT
jgi:hypothetical protein